MSNVHRPTSRVLAFIPHFNCAAMLADALHSLATQTEVPDVLVIDDHSDPPEWDAARAHAAGRVRFMRTRETNVGPAALANDAHELAMKDGYEFLARLDADDISYPRRIEFQMRFLDSNAKLVACGANCSYLDNSLQPIGMSTVPTSPSLVRVEALVGLRGVVQGSLMFRVSESLDVRYDEGLRNAEDTDIILRLTEGGRVANLPHTCCGIRLRSDSLSTRSVVESVARHFFVIERYKRRRRRLRERAYEDFRHDPRVLSAIGREVAFLATWREAMRSRSRTAAIRAGIRSPKRVLARALRSADAALARLQLAY